VIGNGDGGGKKKVRSSGVRSFQRRGAMMDMARYSGAFGNWTSGWTYKKGLCMSFNRIN